MALTPELKAAGRETIGVYSDLDAGRVVNRAHAEGVPPATPGNPNPPRVPSPEDEATVDLPAAPSLSIEKTAGPASGNAVGWTGAGRSDSPIRYSSTALAAERPSAMAHTTRDAPR